MLNKGNGESSRTFLDRKKFWHLLIKEHPDYDKYRWFTGTLIDRADYGYFETKGRVALKELVLWTKMALDVIDARFPFIMFPNFMCGWKGMPYNRRYYPIYVQSLDELMELIENHLHFGSENDIENYYITDAGLKWFVILDHEECWSFSAPWSIANKVKRAWHRKYDGKSCATLCEPSRVTSTALFKKLLRKASQVK